MPLNALQIVDQFKMKSQADRSAEQANQVATQMKMDEGLRTLKNRNVLGELMKGNPNDLGAVATDYMTQTGDAEGMMRLQDRANQQEDRAYQNSIRALDSHIKGLDWLSKTGTMVTKDNYAQWRNNAVELGVASAADLPEAYDQNLMDRLTGAASKELKEIKINLPGRKQQQIFTRNGKEVYRSDPYERDAPQKPVESWGPVYQENGRTFQRSNRGKIQEVGSRGAQSGDLGLMDRLVGSGIAEDDTQAWQMLQEYKKNPQAGATQIARMEVQAQRDAGVMPGDPEYRSPQQIYADVRRSIGEMTGEGGAAATDYSPAPAGTKPSKPAASSPSLDNPRTLKRAQDIRARYQSGEISRAEARRLLEEAARG